MFAGHWLVADMDGTLTPTPTKAGGHYLSLTDSTTRFTSTTCAASLGHTYHSALPALRLFLRAGGSLCVVSTAGRRIWQQVYEDIAPAVYANVADTESETDSDTPSGALLLCGFTGAALFHTLSIADVRAAMRAASLPLSSLPPASVGLKEWEAYRQTAGTLAAHTEGETHEQAHSCLAGAAAPTTLDADVRDAAVEEGRRAIIRFFEHASFVSHHNLDTARLFFQECLSTKYHDVYTAMLQRCLSEVRATQPGLLEGMESGTVERAPICFRTLRVFEEEALTTHGTYLAETKDALVDAQVVDARQLGNTPDEPAAVRRRLPAAQVVVMGIPMRYFESIFPSPSPASVGEKGVEPWQCCLHCAALAAQARPRLIGLGLAVKSQPNSVCIHREGIDKATCVRWLQTHAAELGPTRQFSLDRALGFGDVPASVDRPLWQFPPMQFISLSPKPHAGMDPVRDPAPSHGFYDVGGEEEGTACFLDRLLEMCKKDHNAIGASEVSEAGFTWFTEARVRAAAQSAHEEVTTWDQY